MDDQAQPPPRYVCFGQTHTFTVIMKMLFGVVSAFLTNFVPDEFWQTTEVAHNIVFRYGHLTWEWKQGLRNYFIPGVVASVYKLGEQVGYWERPAFLIMAPQVVQGLLSLVALKLYFHFCMDRMGVRIGRWAYSLMVMNWFTTYCFARTITNTTEMSFNILCLYHLQRGNPGFFMTFLVTNFFIRPTTAIFWIPFIPEFFKKFKTIEVAYSICFGAVIGLYMFSIDTIMYHRMILTPWEFFKFNFLSAGNEEFGVHNPLWYFYSAIPSILGPLALLLPLGFLIPGETRKLSFYTLFYVSVFSCIGHKEIRFLLPILPLVFIILASVAWEGCLYLERNNIFGSEERRARILRYVHDWFIFLNLVAAFYFGVFHQRGFRSVAVPFQNEDLPLIKYRAPEVWILAPCYSMPVHTYMHYPQANFVFFVCPPKNHQHWYNTESPTSHLMLQKGSFNVHEMIYNIHLKYRGRGPPDWIFTYTSYGLPVLHTLGKLHNATYLPKDMKLHNFFGEYDRYVVLFQRVK